jgi:hypothetical protein
MVKRNKVLGPRIYKIRELDPDIIRPNYDDITNVNRGGHKLTVIGKPGTGKSYLIRSLLYEKRHVLPTGLVFSGTEDSNSFYGTMFPKSFIYNGLDLDQLKKFVERQKVSRKFLPCPWSVLIIDDCMDDSRLFNKPLIQGLYKNGRHWSMLYILSLQYSLDIKPSIRTNIDGTFILREPNRLNREKLWKNYAGIIPNFDDFCAIMDQLTSDYTALYIHNATTSNRVEDCVFWYKAKPVPEGFKIGCPEYWAHHEKRYNQEYKDSYF